MPLAHHVMLRLASRGNIVPNVVSQRRAAEVLCRVGRGYGLWAFHVPDGHAHAGLGPDRERAGRFARAAEVALRAAFPLLGPFEPALIKPIVNRRHLESAAHYIFGQSDHHGLACDTALESSNLPDLLGMRLTGSHTIERFRELFPRWGRDDLLPHLGVHTLGESIVPELLAESAAAALALPDTIGQTPNAVRARAAMLQLLPPDAEMRAEIAPARSTRERLVATAVPAPLLRAIMRQCNLRHQRPELQASRPAPDLSGLGHD